MVEEIRKKIRRIYIHCSDSLWGDVGAITDWHVQRGFKTIGYHFVICNQFPFYLNLKENSPDESYDGKIQKGRDINEDGAHVADSWVKKNGNIPWADNEGTIAISLIGIDHFTSGQYYNLFWILQELLIATGLNVENVWGHYEFYLNNGYPKLRTCPNIDMGWLRTKLSGEMARGQRGSEKDNFIARHG